MNFFSKFLTDPDKKFNDSDKDLIKRITEGLFKSDPKIRLIEQDHDTGALERNYNDKIVSFFKKGEKKFRIVFFKVSESKKKDFSHEYELAYDYCRFYGCETVRELEKKVKKIVGITINLNITYIYNLGVGSEDDPRNNGKLYDQARNLIPNIVKDIIEKIEK